MVSKWGYFFLGIVLTAVLAAVFLSVFHSPIAMERIKALFFLVSVLSAIGAFFSMELHWKMPSTKRLPKIIQRADIKELKVDTTGEIQNMINDMAKKTRQTNEMIFNQRLDLQNKSIIELTQSMGIDLPLEEEETEKTTESNYPIKRKA